MAKSAFPDGITAAACEPRKARRVIGLRFLIFALILSVALLGFVGGHKATSRSARNAEATFVVTGNDRLRNGNFYETRFTIMPHRSMADAVITLPEALWHEVTVNSLHPEPDSEEYRDGEYRMHLGAIEAGQKIVFKIDGQLNPPLFGHVTGAYRLLDGEKEIARVPLDLWIIP